MVKRMSHPLRRARRATVLEYFAVGQQTIHVQQRDEFISGLSDPVHETDIHLRSELGRRLDILTVDIQNIGD